LTAIAKEKESSLGITASESARRIYFSPRSSSLASMIGSFLLFSELDPVVGVVVLQLVIGGCIGGLSVLFRKIEGKLQAKNDAKDPKKKNFATPRTLGDLE
jgi:hypothetical protein